MKYLIIITIFCYSLPIMSMDRASQSIKEQHALAVSLLEKRYQNTYDSRVAFMEELQGHIQKYPDTQIHCSAQARLGDVLKDLARNQAAKAAYKTAYQDRRGLALSRGWAALQLGYMYLTEKKYGLARGLFESSLTKVNHNYLYHVYNGWGVAFYGLKQPMNALKCWSYVVQLAQLREEQLQQEDNTLEKRKIVEFLAKYKARALYNSSVTLEDSGEYGKALSCLCESQRISPKLSSQEFSDRVSRLKTLSSTESLSLQ